MLDFACRFSLSRNDCWNRPGLERLATLRAFFISDFLSLLCSYQLPGLLIFHQKPCVNIAYRSLICQTKAFFRMGPLVDVKHQGEKVFPGLPAKTLQPGRSRSRIVRHCQWAFTSKSNAESGRPQRFCPTGRLYSGGQITGSLKLKPSSQANTNISFVV